MSATNEFLTDLSMLLEVEKEILKPDFCLVSWMNWDSLAKVSTIALLDQHFNIKIEGAVLEECKVLNDLFNLTKENKDI